MHLKIDFLIDTLLNEMPEYKEDAKNINDKKILLRSLMNLRPPMKLDNKFLEAQNEFLKHERDIKGITDAEALPQIQNNISIWQGDITTLNADAIVNAANSSLLGCFIPCHNCIDNAIHSAAGLQLRDECNNLITAQGHNEPEGKAKITNAYNLPCKYVIHTVGPLVTGKLNTQHREILRSCYTSCLRLANEYNLKSLAFCCISTGEFHFPNFDAAVIAINSVKDFLYNTHSNIHVIFNVFKYTDLEIYSQLLNC